MCMWRCFPEFWCVTKKETIFTDLVEWIGKNWTLWTVSSLVVSHEYSSMTPDLKDEASGGQWAHLTDKKWQECCASNRRWCWLSSLTPKVSCIVSGGQLILLQRCSGLWGRVRCERQCVAPEVGSLSWQCPSSFSLINEAFYGPTSKSQSWNTWSVHQVLLPVTFFYFQNWKRYMKGTKFRHLQHTRRPATQDLNIILKEDLRIYQSMDKEKGVMC